MMEKDRKQILSALTNALLVEKAIQNQLLSVSDDLMDDPHINTVYKISITRMNMIKAEMRSLESSKSAKVVTGGHQPIASSQPLGKPPTGRSGVKPPSHHMVIEHA